MEVSAPKSAPPLSLLMFWVLVRVDTDSVMIQVPDVEPTQEDIDKYGFTVANMKAFWAVYEKIGEELTHLFNAPHLMELENTDWPFLLYHLKKNYGYTCWKSWLQPKKDTTSGFGFLKRDRCHWVRETCRLAFGMMLAGNQDTELESHVRKCLRQLSSNQVDLKDLTVSCSLKDRSEYKNKNDNLVQLRIADKIERRTGARPPSGSRVRYLIVKGSGQNYERAETVSYVRKNRLQVDLEHYLDQCESILKLICSHHKHAINVAKCIAECRRDIKRYYSLNDKGSLLNFFKRQKTEADDSNGEVELPVKRQRYEVCDEDHSEDDDDQYGGMHDEADDSDVDFNLM